MQNNETMFCGGEAISILKEIRDMVLLQFKEVLTVKDLCLYTGFSQHYVYSLVGKKAITFFKPLGKKIFFKKEDVLDFLTTNQIASNEAVQKKASKHFITSNKIK